MADLRPVLVAAALIASATIFSPTQADAGRIESACSASERAEGNRALCGCIQRIADQLLTRTDQRLAASFFKDPHRAQEIRQSDKSSDERFWLRYKQFGDQAQRYCR